MPEYQVREISDQVERDSFGPEHVYEVYDPQNGECKKGWVVIDNTARSPKGIGKGGTAMYPDLTLDITLRKARIMTWKQVFCVPIGESSRYEPWGGAKGGIVYDSSLPDSEEVLRAWARSLGSRGVIPDKYIFGLDVGLKEWATKAVVEELGNPKVSTGKPIELGGIPYDQLGVTGYGLVEALKAMCPYADIDFKDATCAIQGFGAVGGGFSEHLLKLAERPKIVAVSDWGGAIYNQRGLDMEEVLRVCKERGTVVSYEDAEQIPLGEELFLPTDISILAYKEDQITPENMGKVQARIILQGANSGITEEAEELLHKNGKVITVPDFVVNCGASTIVYIEYNDGTLQEGWKQVQRVITNNTRLVIEESSRRGISPRRVAQGIAEEQVLAAMD